MYIHLSHHPIYFYGGINNKLSHLISLSKWSPMVRPFFWIVATRVRVLSGNSYIALNDFRIIINRDIYSDIILVRHLGWYLMSNLYNSTDLMFLIVYFLSLLLLSICLILSQVVSNYHHYLSHFTLVTISNIYWEATWRSDRKNMFDWYMY